MYILIVIVAAESPALNLDYFVLQRESYILLKELAAIPGASTLRNSDDLSSHVGVHFKEAHSHNRKAILQDIWEKAETSGRGRGLSYHIIWW